MHLFFTSWNCQLQAFQPTRAAVQAAPLSSLQRSVGLFGLGEDGPSEASDTAGLAKPSEDQSTEAPKAFQGKNQGENDTEQRNEITETSPSAATQVNGRWQLCMAVRPPELVSSRPGCAGHCLNRAAVSVVSPVLRFAASPARLATALPVLSCFPGSNERSLMLGA